MLRISDLLRRLAVLKWLDNTRLQSRMRATRTDNTVTRTRPELGQKLYDASKSADRP